MAGDAAIPVLSRTSRAWEMPRSPAERRRRDTVNDNRIDPYLRNRQSCERESLDPGAASRDRNDFPDARCLEAFPPLPFEFALAAFAAYKHGQGQQKHTYAGGYHDQRQPARHAPPLVLHEVLVEIHVSLACHHHTRRAGFTRRKMDSPWSRGRQLHQKCTIDAPVAKLARAGERIYSRRTDPLIPSSADPSGRIEGTLPVHRSGTL